MFMKPVFLVCKFYFEDCLLSIPVVISILASEMSAFDPAQKAFLRGIGLAGNYGLLPGPPLVLALELADGGKELLGAASFFGVELTLAIG
jgi:hypothetical protein